MLRRKLVIGGLVLGAGVLGLVGTAGAASSGGVHVVASIGGRPISGVSSSNPIKIHTDSPAILDVRVDNRTANPIEIRTVRLSGQVMGLTFYQLDASVDFFAGPGETTTRTFPLDVSGLSGQATGLIPSQVTIFDAGHHELAAEGTLVDVRGSWHSVFGLFGLAVALVTALLFVRLLVGVARHTLSPNRFYRAASFVPAGIGVALVIVFTLSAARILSPQATTWAPTIVIAAAILFAVGYLSPGGGDDSESESESEGDAEWTSGGEESGATADLSSPLASTGTANPWVLAAPTSPPPPTD